MRKTSYVVTFFAVLASFILNIVSLTEPQWIVVKYPKFLGTTITEYYGLMELCTTKVVSIPDPDQGNPIEYTNYVCRAFPKHQTDRCEQNSGFCTSWSTAGYASELAVGCGALTLFTLIVGVSTHSRRRRIWRAVAGLIVLHSAFQIIAFAVVTDSLNRTKYPTFDRAKPGLSYALAIVSWIFGIVTAAGVVVTGLSADRGHSWAAGNRAYRPIQ